MAEAKANGVENAKEALTKRIKVRISEKTKKYQPNKRK
jgi:hypothetical protein